MRIAHLILCILSSTLSFGQDWQFEVEGGVNSSGLPRSDHYGGGKERIRPRISPVIGLHIKKSAANGLYAMVGSRYTNVGVETLYHRDGVSELDGTTYTFDIDERMAFSRFSIGAALGYRHSIWKKYCYVHVGYRTNRYVSGSYSYHAYKVNDDGTRSDLEKSYDPFTDPTLQRRAKRNGWEAFAGMGVELGKHWSLGLQVAISPQIRFIEQQVGPIDTPNSLHTYSKTDFCVSVSYRFGLFGGEN